MQQHYPELPFERYVDDGVVHCRTKAEALLLKEAVTLRLEQCGLELHPQKPELFTVRMPVVVDKGILTTLTFWASVFEPPSGQKAVSLGYPETQKAWSKS